jgi:hypothetical protein
MSRVVLLADSFILRGVPGRLVGDRFRRPVWRRPLTEVRPLVCVERSRSRPPTRAETHALIGDPFAFAELCEHVYALMSKGAAVRR